MSGTTVSVELTDPLGSRLLVNDSDELGLGLPFNGGTALHVNGPV